MKHNQELIDKIAFLVKDWGREYLEDLAFNLIMNCLSDMEIKRLFEEDLQTVEYSHGD